MIQSTINFLLLLAGVVALYFAIRKTEPRLWTLCISFAIAGAITLVVIVTRRQLAQRSQAAAALGSWWDEMLVGGAPLIASPYLAGSERLPGLVLWLLLWAVYLYNDTEGDREHRGPWVLALLPLIVFIVGAMALRWRGVW